MHTEPWPVRNRARGKGLLTGKCRPTGRGRLLGLVVGVGVGLGILLAAGSALAAEPQPSSITVAVAPTSPGASVAASTPSEAMSSMPAACSIDECSPPTETPDATLVPMSSRPGTGSVAYSSPLDGKVRHLNRLKPVGEQQVGVRIVQPLYATVAMPRRPSWSPLAGRPATHRILVGLRFVVPF